MSNLYHEFLSLRDKDDTTFNKSFESLFVLDFSFFLIFQINYRIINLKRHRLSNFKNFTMQNLHNELSIEKKTRTKSKTFIKSFITFSFNVAKEDSNARKNIERDVEKANQFLNVEKKKSIVIKEMKKFKYDNNDQILNKSLLNENEF